jgi:allantoate deiminase
VGVETDARRTSGLVATVGSIEANPGATNVIPGKVHLTVDVRHPSDEVRTQFIRHLTVGAREIAARRGLALNTTVLLEQSAVTMDPLLTSEIVSAIRASGCTPHRMPSGAGHDAMILAERIPAAMIFLRTPGGISHDPAESVLVEDVACAIESGTNLLRRLAASSEFLQRTNTTRA